MCVVWSVDEWVELEFITLLLLELLLLCRMLLLLCKLLLVCLLWLMLLHGGDVSVPG